MKCSLHILSEGMKTLSNNGICPCSQEALEEQLVFWLLQDYAQQKKGDREYFEGSFKQ